MRKIYVVVVVSAFFGRASVEIRADEKDDILFQKQDLDDIQQEVDLSHQKLDSLKQLELQIQKSVAEYDQKIATNKKVTSRLSQELKQLKRQISSAEQELTESADRLERNRRRYLGNIRQFYYIARHPVQDLSEDVNTELELNRRVVYLTALSDFESGNVNQAADYLAESRQNLSQLSGQKEKVTHLKKKKETATELEKTRKNKEQRELERLRRKKTEEADRILTLEQAAREIERIIARLQQQHEQSLPADFVPSSAPSAFNALQGQLLSPFPGEIVVGFGSAEDPVTKLKSFSPGITIKGRAGHKVVAVADGTVAYVGSLRGYGNFVIINHDDQYYSTYGGLGETSVTTNEYVLAGTSLAVAGKDGQVKFELRQGRQPLDPVKWIRFDSF